MSSECFWMILSFFLLPDHAFSISRPTKFNEVVGKFTIRFVNFSNTQHLISTGTGCDVGWFGSKLCDPRFTICFVKTGLQWSKNITEPMDKCDFAGPFHCGPYDNTGEIAFSSSLCKYTNPMVINITRAWSGVEMYVRVDEMERGSFLGSNTAVGPLIDFFRQGFNGHPEKNHQKKLQTIKGTTKANTTLTIEALVQCLPNYYDVKCSTFCLSSARYGCDPHTGQIVCKTGWSGDECTARDVSEELTIHPLTYGSQVDQMIVYDVEEPTRGNGANGTTSSSSDGNVTGTTVALEVTSTTASILDPLFHIDLVDTEFHPYFEQQSAENTTHQSEPPAESVRNGVSTIRPTTMSSIWPLTVSLLVGGFGVYASSSPAPTDPTTNATPAPKLAISSESNEVDTTKAQSKFVPVLPTTTAVASSTKQLPTIALSNATQMKSESLVADVYHGLNSTTETTNESPTVKPVPCTTKESVTASSTSPSVVAVTATTQSAPTTLLPKVSPTGHFEYFAGNASADNSTSLLTKKKESLASTSTTMGPVIRNIRLGPATLTSVVMPSRTSYLNLDLGAGSAKSAPPVVFATTTTAGITAATTTSPLPARVKQNPKTTGELVSKNVSSSRDVTNATGQNQTIEVPSKPLKNISLSTVLLSSNKTRGYTISVTLVGDHAMNTKSTIAPEFDTTKTSTRNASHAEFTMPVSTSAPTQIFKKTSVPSIFHNATAVGGLEPHSPPAINLTKSNLSEKFNNSDDQNMAVNHTTNLTNGDNEKVPSRTFQLHSGLRFPQPLTNMGFLDQLNTSVNDAAEALLQKNSLGGENATSGLSMSVEFTGISINSSAVIPQITLFAQLNGRPAFTELQFGMILEEAIINLRQNATVISEGPTFSIGSSSKASDHPVMIFLIALLSVAIVILIGIITVLMRKPTNRPCQASGPFTDQEEVDLSSSFDSFSSTLAYDNVAFSEQRLDFVSDEIVSLEPAVARRTHVHSIQSPMAVPRIPVHVTRTTSTFTKATRPSTQSTGNTI